MGYETSLLFRPSGTLKEPFVPSDKSLGYFLSSLRDFFLHTNLKPIFTSSKTTIYTEPWGPRKHKSGR